MARKRMIDPAFFLDNEVASMTPHARLLYIGSWTLADDVHFTLPNNPDWIKVQIFPYEMKIDVAKLIDEIVGIGKYLKFTNGDKKEYLFIPTMGKHQTINRPSKAKYPRHPDTEKYLSATGVFKEDSQSTHSEVNISKEKRIEVEGVVSVWNDLIPWKVKSISNERIKHISARLNEEIFREQFKDICNKILTSDFLMGKADGRAWKADFDWIIANDLNYVKVLEGKYDNKPTGRRSDRIC